MEQATHAEPLDVAADVRPKAAPLRFFAQLLSYLFHPLFIPLYVAAFLLYIHPLYFSGFSDAGKSRLMLLLLLDTVFFPAITVLLLKGLGFIESIFLRTQKDRIIPYIAAMTFYFWAQYVLRQTQMPPVIGTFMFGVFLASAAGLLANIYFKVSMHAMGMGGMTGICLAILQQDAMLMTWPLALTLLLSGMVCTARLIVSNHTPREIYYGFFIGLLCQWIAALLYLH